MAQAPPGLGKFLYDALGGEVIVIGVAKTAFRGIPPLYQLFRGGSKRPLYVTAAGVHLDLAKDFIRSMHGEHRLPTMLKRVDRAQQSCFILPRFCKTIDRQGDR